MRSALLTVLLAAGVAAAFFSDSTARMVNLNTGGQVMASGITGQGVEGDKKKKKEEKADGGKEAEPKVEKIKIDPKLGIISGKVSLEGDAPKFDNKIEVPGNHQDKAVCAAHVKDERCIVGKKKELKNAVVYLEDWKFKGKTRPKPRTVKLENKGCLFNPHILLTTVGSTLEISNSDTCLHNTRGVLATGGINSAIAPGATLKKKLRKPGWGVMNCDFHTWMRSHVHVFAHEYYAVTSADGTYKIYNVPPGKYKLKFWHESLQNIEKEVVVTAGKTTSLDAGLEAYKD